MAADGLCQTAATKYAWRSFDGVGESALDLISSGLPAYSSIGHYYAGRATLKAGIGDPQAAAYHFEIALEDSPLAFRERIILAQSLIPFYRGDYQERAVACESLANSSDPYVFVEAKRGIAVVLSIEGNHQKALDILLPLASIVARYSNTLSYYDYFNSLAEELKETGNLRDAKKASSIALSSPYSNRYDEWQETGRDIDGRITRPAKAFVPRSPLRLVTKPKPDIEFQNQVIARNRMSRILSDWSISAAAINAGASVIEKEKG